MKNLNVFDGNVQEFLDDIINSKKKSKEDPNFKDRVKILVPNIKALYNSFDVSHNYNSHISLNPYGYVNGNKNDLLKLYTSDNSKLVKLKNKLTTILDNRIMNTCQYCTMTPINSLDHIVPKGEFPEFAVNPKNLLPACSACNSYKSENWRENNKTLFLNLYTDILPQVQYLFVDLNITADYIETKFELKNINNIDPDLFELLESHYRKLYLPNRFSKKSNDIISELKNIIISNKLFLDKTQIVQVVQEKINRDKILFGCNYYKSILEETLINNEIFIDSIF